MKDKKYSPPKTPVKIQKGDKGFDITRKNYHRFIWSWDEYSKGIPDLIDPNIESSSVEDTSESLKTNVEIFQELGKKGEVIFNFTPFQDWISRNYSIVINPKDLEISDKLINIDLKNSDILDDNPTYQKLKRLQNDIESQFDLYIEDCLVDIYKKKIKIVLRSNIKTNI